MLNPIVRTDIDVPTLLASVGGDHFPERREELVKILDIDTRKQFQSDPVPKTDFAQDGICMSILAM